MARFHPALFARRDRPASRAKRPHARVRGRKSSCDHGHRPGAVAAATWRARSAIKSTPGPILGLGPIFGRLIGVSGLAIGQPRALAPQCQPLSRRQPVAMLGDQLAVRQRRQLGDRCRAGIAELVIGQPRGADPELPAFCRTLQPRRWPKRASSWRDVRRAIKASAARNAKSATLRTTCPHIMRGQGPLQKPERGP